MEEPFVHMQEAKAAGCPSSRGVVALGDSLVHTCCPLSVSGDVQANTIQVFMQRLRSEIPT